MIELIHREFIVDASLEAAWNHLAQIEHWPSWAKHIRSVKLTPPGAITPNAIGTFRLTNGISSAFQVTELNRHVNWQWRGPFLWLQLAYDHRFASLADGRTKFTWVVAVEGMGTSTVGRLFAWHYNRNLDRAIPLLQQELAT